MLAIQLNHSTGEVSKFRVTGNRKPLVNGLYTLLIDGFVQLMVDYVLKHNDKGCYRKCVVNWLDNY